MIHQSLLLKISKAKDLKKEGKTKLKVIQLELNEVITELDMFDENKNI